MAARAAALRPRLDRDAVLYATKLAMRSLGRRVLTIDDEIARLDAALAELITATAPGLLGLYGVGVDTAAICCVAAGDNPQRVRSEAAWAHLCGVAPLEATSGKVVRRHRLNQGGNRQANHALWRIVFTVSAPMPAPAATSPAASTTASAAPRSSAASRETSPARPTDTFHADDLQRRAWPNNCLTLRRGVSFDRPADPPLPTHPAPPGPHKSPPSPSGPSLVCQYRRDHLDNT